MTTRLGTVIGSRARTARRSPAEVRTLKAQYTLATVKLALSKYRQRDPPRGPRSLGLLVLRPRKMRSGQRFSYLALEPEETHAAYHERIHHDQSNLIPLDPEAFIQTALELLSSDRYLQKAMGLDGPHRAQARRHLL
jgi:hypothetical protein